MKNIKVGTACLNQTALDFSGNFTRICGAIKEAYENKVALLLLPELCITGYGCEDAFFMQDIQNKAKDYLNQIIGYIEILEGSFNYNILVSVGLPYFYQGALYNVSALINSKRVIAFIPKQNLANDGVHYESRWFRPWQSGYLDHIPHFNAHIPFGDALINFNGIKIGYEICQDAWVSNRPGINHAKHGVDIILNPSASHFAFGKHDTRKQFIKEGSRAFRCAYMYANLLGNEAGTSIFEGDTFIATAGKIVASGHRLSFKDSILTTAIIDIDCIRTIQTMDGSNAPDLNKHNEINTLHELPVHSVYENQYGLDRAEVWSKEEEFTHAQVLGLFDYMRKSHCQGFTLSLSGGADSTVCASLIKFMHDFGVEELGQKEFIAKSGIKFPDEDNLMKTLLTSIYQATYNSSEETLKSAQVVAETIGATFMNFNINSLVEDYKSIVGYHTGRALNWEDDDIALQNIQARVRVPGLWMVANLNNSLLICTSNRSEMAVGYSTADGDLSGSICPLGGIDKHFLLDWLFWVQHEYGPELRGRGFIKESQWVECLDIVNSLKPSAELRPLEKVQLDSDDLMPYDILDHIERKAIIEKKSPQEVLECVKNRFGGRVKSVPSTMIDQNIKIDIFRGYVNKFFKLWSRNQWKRHKGTPSFRV